MIFKSNEKLNDNQKKLSASIDDKLLQRLEAKAASKVRHFTGRLNSVKRDIARAEEKNEGVTFHTINRKRLYTERLEFWEQRQQDIQQLISERILLQYETESKKH